MKQIDGYLFDMINKWYTCKKSGVQPGAYNLTKGKEKLMVRQGWMENTFDWFVTPVSDHGSNGKLIGETVICAEWRGIVS